MSSRTGVRGAIVGMFALLLTAFTVTEGQSQFRRPSVPSPRIPTPRPPQLPRMPVIPPVGPSVGPRFVDVWSCGNCKTELGRGAKPALDSCPRCGVRFVNGGAGGIPNFRSTPTPLPETGNSADPDLAPRGISRFAPGTPPGTSAPSTVLPPSSSETRDGSTPPSPSGDRSSEPISPFGALVLKVMISIFGVLFLMGILGGITLIIIANRRQVSPRARRRPQPLELDECPAT